MERPGEPRVRSRADSRGALLILAGTDLAILPRLFDGKPACLPVIGVTAVVTLTINPALGLVLGWIAEFIRAAIVRSVYRTPQAD